MQIMCFCFFFTYTKALKQFNEKHDLIYMTLKIICEKNRLFKNRKYEKRRECLKLFETNVEIQRIKFFQ